MVFPDDVPSQFIFEHYVAFENCPNWKGQERIVANPAAVEQVAAGQQVSLERWLVRHPLLVDAVTAQVYQARLAQTEVGGVYIVWQARPSFSAVSHGRVIRRRTCAGLYQPRRAYYVHGTIVQL